MDPDNDVGARREQGVRYHLEALRRVPLLADLVCDEPRLTDHAARLEQLWFLYEVLERGARQFRSEGGRFSHLFVPALDRLSSTESSLQAVQGPDWRDGLAPLPTTSRYVQILEDVIERRVEASFLGHHYVRYTGDAGTAGLLASRLRTFAAATDDMLRCFEFPGITDPVGVRGSYRKAISRVGLNPVETDDFLEATELAFVWSELIFQEVIDVRDGVTDR